MKLPGRRGLPDDAVPIVEARLMYWQQLDTIERQILLDHADWLLRKKYWEAAAGFALDDTIRVVIASQAALLILGLGTDHYRLVSSIIVHPSTSIATGERAGPIPGTRTREPMAIHGLAQDRHGPVLIAWDEASSAARHPERGHNVVFHEFAHKIDMLDGLIDGTPPLEAAAMRSWIATCTEVYEALRSGADRPPLRPYGATNPGEFFAVATEAFFAVPRLMAANEPGLYGVLRDFYEQDPASRLPAAI